MNPPLGQQPRTPAGGTWHMSQLKKTISVSTAEDMPEGVLKRDSSDSFQTTRDIEEEKIGFQHEKDGFKEEIDTEQTAIDGEESFIDTETEEDEEFWESEEDYFQELAERNALLEEALRERIQSPFPPVYNQIMNLCEALSKGEKTLKPPAYYIEELNKYIEKKTKVFSELPKVDNDAITKSNQLMLDGLTLLVEVCNTLKKYIDSPAPYHIDLARQITKQANEFFSRGKDLLLSVKIDEKS